MTVTKIVPYEPIKPVELNIHSECLFKMKAALLSAVQVREKHVISRNQT